MYNLPKHRESKGICFVKFFSGMERVNPLLSVLMDWIYLEAETYMYGRIVEIVLNISI